MRSAAGALGAVEVVVFSVVNGRSRAGIPSVKVRNVAVDSAEDNCHIGIESRLVCGKESHTCNCLGKRACAGVVEFYELAGGISGLAVHRYVTLVLVGGIACKGDVTAELGVNNCNCSVCAPGTADSGASGHYACVRGELTTVEDCAVNYGVGSALVRALECGDVACSTLIVLGGVDNVDSTVLEEGGIVSTEDEVGVTADEYVLEILTTGEELEGILDTEKLGVLHYESVCLNEECKRSLNLDARIIHSLLGVPVVGDGYVLDSYVICGLSYCNGGGRVGNVAEAAGVGKTVDGVPLDNYFVGSITKTYDIEVRNGNLELFVIVAGSDIKHLNCVSVNFCSVFKSFLNGSEYVIRTAEHGRKTFVRRINEELIYAVLVGSRNCIGNGNHYGGRKTVSFNGEGVEICARGVEAGNGVIVNDELKSVVATLSNYGNGKTAEVELFTYEVKLAEAMVIIYAVAVRVVGNLLNSVEAKLNRLGGVDGYVEGYALVILIRNYHGISAAFCGVNCGGVNGNEVKSEGLGLAVGEGSVKSYAGEVECFTYEIVNLAVCNECEAVLIRLFNYAGKGKCEDILSTAVLTAADNPFTLGNVELNLYYGVAAYSCFELKVVYGTVGSGYGDELHINAAGAVLNEEGKLTVAGNCNLNLGCGVTNLYGLGVINAVIGLVSVSDFRAGNDGEDAVDGVCAKSARRKVGDVERIADLLVSVGDKLKGASVTEEVTVSVVVSRNCGLVANVAIGAKRTGEGGVTCGGTGGLGNVCYVVVAERLTNVGVAVHTVSSLGTGCGSPYGVVLLGELFTTAHTFTGLAAKNEPAPVTFCRNVIALYLTAEGTYCVVFTVGGTGSIDFRLHVPVVNLGVEYFYFLIVAATVSAVYLLKTVGLSLAVSLNENLSFTPEAVSLGINRSCLGVVVIANRTLENGNAGSGTGSSLKLGVEENVLFKLVLVVVFTALALTFNEVVLVRGNVVGIGLAALTLAVYEAMLVRGNVVRIGRATRANAVLKFVLCHCGLPCNVGFLTVFTGISNVTC